MGKFMTKDGSRSVILFALRGIFIFFIIFVLGISTGIAAVIFSPMVIISFIGISIVVLLWVMPEIDIVSQRFLEIFFLVAVASQLIIPQYYALALPGLPWLSIRRGTWILFVVVASIALASSRVQRQRVIEVIRSAPFLNFLIIGYLITIAISVISARYMTIAFRNFTESILYWYAAYIGAILCVRDDGRVNKIFMIVLLTLYVAVPMGVYEMWSGHRFLFDILPDPIKAALFAGNPGLAEALSTTSLRNGMYRASFVFFVPLSFGEYLAMCAPIALYIGLHAEKNLIRLLGYFAFLLSIVGIFTSGSRGAWLGLFLSTPIMVVAWVARRARQEPGSLIPTIVAVTAFIGAACITALFMLSGRLYSVISGGGQGALSTDARFAQWEAAKPWIFSNPITGHGIGLAADLVGFFNPGSTAPTLDSTLINVLVETGIPGLITFFGGLLVAVIILVWTYIFSPDPRAKASIAIACSLASYLSYRFTLSQRENNTFAFVLLGLAACLLCMLRERSRTLTPTVTGGSALRSGYFRKKASGELRAREFRNKSL